MQEKLAITVLVIMLALFALVLVLYNLVKSKGESYNQIVLSHQDYESRTIPYKRGNIIDRNGTYLAISEKVYNLVIDPKQILDTVLYDSIFQGMERNDRKPSARCQAFNHRIDRIFQHIQFPV